MTYIYFVLTCETGSKCKLYLHELIREGKRKCNFPQPGKQETSVDPNLIAEYKTRPIVGKHRQKRNITA